MDDLISEFISETTASLGVLDAELAKLDQNPGDAEVLSTIHRLVRTIKGTCGFLELKRLESIAEAVEEVLADVGAQKLAMAPHVGFALLEALSSIRNIMDYLAQHGHEPDGNDAALLARLRDLVALSPAQINTAAAATAAASVSRAEMAEPSSVREQLPPMMSAGMPPVVASAAAMSDKLKREAIRHGLDVTAPTHSAPVVAATAEIKTLLADVVHARNQLKAQEDINVVAPLASLNRAVTTLKHIIAQTDTQSEPTIAVVLAQAAGHTFALPQRYVLEVVDLAHDETARVETINNTPVLIKGKRVIPLIKLRSLLKISEFPSIREERVAVLRVGDAEFGLVVEEASELFEAVLQTLPRALAKLSVYRGAIRDGRDTLVLVLDAAGLARAIGFRQVVDVAPQPTALAATHHKSFLVFRAGAGAPKALLLDQVIRIDEMLPSQPALRVATLPGMILPRDSTCETIVVSTATEPVALAVDKVIDIMQAPLEITSMAGNPPYLGTVTIAGRATELVDVNQLVASPVLEAA